MWPFFGFACCSMMYLTIKKHLDHQNLDILGMLSIDLYNIFAFFFVYTDIWMCLSTEFECSNDYKIMGHI